MIEEQPDVYYTAEHYENYDCVLVRLSRINREILGDLLRTSHRFVIEKYKGKKPPKPRASARKRKSLR